MRYLLLTLTVGCAAIDPGEGEELGVRSAAIESCPSGQWCIETPPVAVLLHGVFAVSADDVFAVGDQGTILRRSGDQWTEMSSGTTKNLRGVWAASSSDVWAVGVEGTILRFDGTSWSRVITNETLPFDAVWGSSANDVWLAGSSRVVRWDGLSFRTFNLTGTLLSVHGSSSTDVWASGENSPLWRYNGFSWSMVSVSGIMGGVYTVLALSRTDAFITTPTPTKETLRFVPPTKWAAKTTNLAFFYALSAFSASDIWGAGFTIGGAVVGRWNGVSWATEQPFGSGGKLFSATTAPGHVWVVGEDGLIGHRSL
jgi:hypothetical protein